MSEAADTPGNDVTAETATPPVPRYKPTPLESDALVAQFARRKAKPPAPKLKISEHRVEVDHPEPAVGYTLLMEALGTTDTAFINGILTHLANVSAKEDDTDANEAGLNFLLSMVKAMAPKDEIETMLGAQMAIVHLATMTMANRLQHASTLPLLDSAERGLNKLARTFASQLEAAKEIPHWRRAESHRRARPRLSGGTGHCGECRAHGAGGPRKNQRVNPMLLDMRSSPRCGARTRRGTPCLGPAMPNGRCRMHGGSSPGAPKGNRNALKHGHYSQEAIKLRRGVSAPLRRTGMRLPSRQA